MDLSEIKPKIIHHLVTLLDEKINLLQDNLNDIKLSAHAEEKSSMGDKYETGRAVANQSYELIAKQITQLNLQLNQLLKFKINNRISTIQAGCLIKTNHGFLLLAGGAGQLNFMDINIISVSASAPLSKAFIGSTQNQKVIFNNKQYLIEDFA